MAKFEVTGPDGRKFEIEAPDGASQDDAISYIQQTHYSDASNPRQDVNLVADVAKSAGAGVVRGGVGLASLPGLVEQGGRWVINKAAKQFDSGPVVSPETALPGYNDIMGRVERNVGKLYEPKTVAGKYARTIGEFAPGLLFPGGAATLAGRLATNVVLPAVASETAGQITEGTQLEPYARVAGGLVGGMLPQMARRAATPFPMSPERRNHVRLLEREGVDTTAGQATGNRRLQWAEAVSQDTPFAGGRAAAIADRQKEQFTTAALRRAGINARRATPDVIDDAFNTIGQQFDDIASASNISPNSWLPAMRNMRADRFQQIANAYERGTAEALRAPVVRELADELADAIRNGRTIAGRDYQTMRSTIERTARSTTSPELSNALRDIRHTLDDLVGLSLPPARRGEWNAVRQRYRNMLVIEKAAGGTTEDAANYLISPARLKNAAQQVESRRQHLRGRSNYGDLADAGNAVLKPLPQSGTAPRAAVGHMLQLMGAGIGGSTAGAPGFMAGAVAPALGMRALMHPAMQNYLRNQAANIPVPMGSRLAAVPGSVSGYEGSRKKLLEIDVATGKVR